MRTGGEKSAKASKFVRTLSPCGVLRVDVALPKASDREAAPLPSAGVIGGPAAKVTPLPARLWSPTRPCDADLKLRPATVVDVVPGRPNTAGFANTRLLRR